MVKLIPVDEHNYRACIELAVTKEQNDYVASNVFSLAEAYIYYGQCVPMAAYDGETMVGFIMYGFNRDSGRNEIYRVMIDHRFQKRGYGREMLMLVIDAIKEDKEHDVIGISTANPVAQRLYESLGFRATGEVAHGENVLELHYG